MNPGPTAGGYIGSYENKKVPTMRLPALETMYNDRNTAYLHKQPNLRPESTHLSFVNSNSIYPTPTDGKFVYLYQVIPQEVPQEHLGDGPWLPSMQSVQPQFLNKQEHSPVSIGVQSPQIQ